MTERSKTLDAPNLNCHGSACTDSGANPGDDVGLSDDDIHQRVDSANPGDNSGLNTMEDTSSDQTPEFTTQTQMLDTPNVGLNMVGYSPMSGTPDTSARAPGQVLKLPPAHGREHEQGAQRGVAQRHRCRCGRRGRLE